MGSRQDLTIKIRVNDVNRVTGQAQFVYDQEEGPDILKGDTIDYSGTTYYGLIKFVIKNKTRPRVEMCFDECDPDNCVWIEKGDKCPTRPGEPAALKIPRRDRPSREVLKLWNPNRERGAFAYRLNLQSDDVPGGVVWIDPVVINNGGGGGPSEPFHAYAAVLIGIAGAAVATALLSLWFGRDRRW